MEFSSTHRTPHPARLPALAFFPEQGVRVQHPHSRHIWTEPQSNSSSACDGLATGLVPLRVTLEGERASRFLLDVSSSIEEGNGVSGGGSCGEGGGVACRDVDNCHADQGRQCAPFKGVRAFIFVVSLLTRRKCRDNTNEIEAACCVI